MVSLTQWTWVWASSGSWWGTGKPGILQPMGSQRVKHDWATELKLDSILKGRDSTLSTKVHLVNAMVFSVVMYRCELSVKEFMLLNCGVSLLRVPWARRSNQSTLKEISPEYSLEGLMLKLKLRYFGHLMQTTDSLKKTLMLGKIEGRRRMG